MVYQPLDKFIEGTCIDLRLVETYQVDAIHIEGAVARERVVDRIGVCTVERRVALEQVLRQQSRNQRFADATLALKDDVNRTVLVILSFIVIKTYGLRRGNRPN